MIPILKHPIKSMRYMRDMVFPAVALSYLASRYENTHDEKLVGAIDYVAEEMKEVVEECYGEIDRQRLSALVGSLESRLQQLKNSK